jgi:nucleoside-diphosphate-sugar epimerase
VMRVFNTYGPGQPLPAAHAPVIARFLRQAAGNGSLVVHNGGRQTRDYVYIDDVVDGLMAAAISSNVDRRIINIGSGTETDVIALAELIIRTMRQGEVLRNTFEEGGVSRMCADVRLANELLNYTPKVSLADGLRFTVERDPRFQSVVIA